MIAPQSRDHLPLIQADDLLTQALRRALAIIQPALPGMAADYYDHLCAVKPHELAGLMPRTPRAELIAGRVEHLRLLFGGCLDETYFRHIDRVVARVLASGLSIPTINGASACALARAFKLLSAHFRRDPEKAAFHCMALVRVNAMEANIFAETFSRRLQAKALADRQTLADDFTRTAQAIVNELRDTSADIMTRADAMARAADEVSELVARAAEASKTIAGDFLAVASATEELSGSIQEISRQTRHSTQIAGHGAEEAASAGATIEDLTDAAARIGDVVRLIGAVAQKTNLLALNATIEAARAGEAGRGFAVVASEVKVLANQTAAATGDINAQIARMQSVSEGTVKVIADISQTIGQIGAATGQIAAAVVQQQAATTEISQIAQRTARESEAEARQLDHVLRSTQASGAQARQVSQYIQGMAKTAQRVDRSIAEFLESLRRTA